MSEPVFCVSPCKGWVGSHRPAGRTPFPLPRSDYLQDQPYARRRVPPKRAICSPVESQSQSSYGDRMMTRYLQTVRWSFVGGDKRGTYVSRARMAPWEEKDGGGGKLRIRFDCIGDALSSRPRWENFPCLKAHQPSLLPLHQRRTTTFPIIFAHVLSGWRNLSRQP